MRVFTAPPLLTEATVYTDDTEWIRMPRTRAHSQHRVEAATELTHTITADMTLLWMNSERNWDCFNNRASHVDIWLLSSSNNAMIDSNHGHHYASCIVSARFVIVQCSSVLKTNYSAFKCSFSLNNIGLLRLMFGCKLKKCLFPLNDGYFTYLYHTAVFS